MTSNYFLQLEGIAGDSTDPRHPGEIVVLSWAHSFNQPTSPTGSSAHGEGVEHASHADFSVTKYVDSSITELLRKNWSGTQIPKALFTAYRGDGENKPVKYLTIAFSGVIVSNYTVSGGAGDHPTETLTLSCAVVEYSYFKSPGERQSVKADRAARTVT